MRNLALGTVWVVIKREYKQRVFSGSFAASTILIPTFLVVMFVVPSLLMRGTGSGAGAPVNVQQHSAMVTAVVTVSVLLYVLYISLFIYGAILMRGVLEEKQSRVIEVMLCFASPDELMAGKMLGIGALALTQLLIWIAVAAAIVSLSPGAGQALAAMGLGPTAVMFFVIFEVLGYLLYSSMFCAIGGAFNSVDETQQWTLLTVVPLAATGMLLSTVLTEPNSAVAFFASIIPFTSPALMYARVAISQPPAWQITLCIAILIISILISIRVCARIYRVGILMYGKRPTARELIRWTRYAS